MLGSRLIDPQHLRALKQQTEKVRKYDITMMQSQKQPKLQDFTKEKDSCLDFSLNERESLLTIFSYLQNISKTEDLSELIQQSLTLISQICNAEMVMFYLLDGASDEVVIVDVEGNLANRSFKGLRFNRELGILGAVSTSMKPLLTGDFANSRHWLQAIDPNLAANLNNYLTIPLVYEKIFVGAIQVFNYQDDEVDLLHVVADHLVNEIAHKIALCQAHNANDQLKKLIQTLQQIAGTLDREQLFHLVTEHASQLLNAERSSIFLADSDNSELNFQVTYKSNPTEEKENRSSIEGTVIHLFKSVIKNEDKDGLSLPRNDKTEEAFGFTTRSAVTVPLQSLSSENGNQVEKPQILGGMMVLNKIDGDFTKFDNQLLHILASQTTTFLHISDVLENANDLFLGVVKSMVTAIDAKDPYTQGHSLRVSELSVAIAEALGLPENTINNVRVGSLLHDIGKIGTPDHILKKKGALTSQEYDAIKVHTVVGHNIMRQSMALQPVLPAILSHHERLDGSGYPYGLKGDEIPLLSRIVAVADVFDAMASERPYRVEVPIDKIMEYLAESAGILLDEQVVAAIVTLVKNDKIQEIYPDLKA